MKKIIVITSLFLLLVSCWESSDLTQAKDELLDRNPVVSESENTEQSTERSENTSVTQNSRIEIIALDADSPLRFDNIPEDSIDSWEVVISGTILNGWGVDKIEVLFSNSSSDFPDDNYTLQTFKAWDEVFKYIASSKSKVLDTWKNEYIFRAHSWNTENETKVIITVPSKLEQSVWIETKLIGTENDTLLIDLPTSSRYWEPVQLSETSFTYSDINGLEINKEILPEVTCEALTEYLSERMNTWYYWNTCRDIVKEKWIKFNVIRLDGDEYIYERHYIDFINGLYWVYELETWEGVDSENIKEKNEELKENEYEVLTIVDGLMRDIINN